jgi:hypothetical protein
MPHSDGRISGGARAGTKRQTDFLTGFQRCGR